MIQDNIWNVKPSKSQLNKLKSEIRDGTEVTLKISPNAVGDSNDENDFRHKFWLTITQVSRVCKAYENN